MEMVNFTTSTIWTNNITIYSLASKLLNKVATIAIAINNAIETILKFENKAFIIVTF